MRTYRGPDRDLRIWFEAGEIDQVMEDELQHAGLESASQHAAVDIEAFIETYLHASLDQYADLESNVLGLTEFGGGTAPHVRINRDLTGSAMDGEWCPPGIHGRWRATLAHEASHIVLHRMLFEVNMDQTKLFEDVATSGVLFRCLKREVSYQSAGRDWREVQANRGMAALLMPKTIFLQAAKEEVERRGSLQAVTSRLARRFEVSREATAIRLATFGFREAEVGTGLFA
jgi:hypothetical protein